MFIGYNLEMGSRIQLSLRILLCLSVCLALSACQQADVDDSAVSGEVITSDTAGDLEGTANPDEADSHTADLPAPIIDGADPLSCTPGVTWSECAGPRSVTQCNASGAAWEETLCLESEFCYEGTCRAWP